MRLRHKDVDVTPGKIHVKCAWLDKMRRPGSVAITVVKNDSAVDLSTLIEGDPSDVSKTLAGIAEIAWGLGWRPAGLEAAVAAAVRTYE